MKVESSPVAPVCCRFVAGALQGRLPFSGSSAQMLFTLLLLFSLWVFLLMAVRAVSAPTLHRSSDSGARLDADLVERRVPNGSAIRFVGRFGSDGFKHLKFNIGWRAGA